MTIRQGRHGGDGPDSVFLFWNALALDSHSVSVPKTLDLETSSTRRLF